MNELNIYIDWYFKLYEGPKSDIDRFFKVWQETLNELKPMEEILVLADYHVDNLILTKKQEIGLLDFQDAVIGSPAYDLVSLLQDARRKVDFDFADKMLEYYAAETKLDLRALKSNYHTFGIQRNLKILGIFARKSLRDNNSSYLKFIPQVKEYIKHSLKQECSKLLFSSFILENL